MGGCSSANNSADAFIAEAKQELRSVSNMNFHKAGTLLDMDDINKKTRVDAVNVAETLNHLGLVSLSQDKFSDSRNYFERALKIYDKSLGDKHISSAETREFLARCLLQYAKHEDGIRFWIGPHPDAEKKYAEATQLLENSVQVFQETHGSDSVLTAKVYAAYANALTATEKFEEADSFYTQAMTIMDKSLTFNTQVSPRGIDCRFTSLDALRKDFALSGGNGLEITVFDIKKGGALDNSGVRVGMELFEVSEDSGKRKVSISSDIEDLINSLQTPATLHFREMLYVDACRILTNWASCLKTNAQFERARNKFDIALRICRFSHGETSLEYSNLEKEYGHSLQKEGRLEEAYRAYSSAFRFHEKTSDKALKALKKKAALVKGKISTDESLQSPTFLMLGMSQVLLSRARAEDAKQHSAKAIKLATKCYGREHATVAYAVNMNASALYLLEKYDEALVGFKEANTLYSIAIDERHPAAIHCLVNQACCLARDNPDVGINAQTNGVGEEYEQALELFTTAMQYYAEAQITDHPCVAVVYSNMASIYYRLGKFDKAIELHGIAGDLRDAILPGGHVLLGLSQLNSARAFLQTKEYAEAEKLGASAFSTFKEELGPDHECVSSCDKIIGDAILELRRPDDAFGQFSEVQRIRNYAVDVPVRRLTLHEAARLHKLGDVADDNDIDCLGESRFMNDNETNYSEDRTEADRTVTSEDKSAITPNEISCGLEEINEGNCIDDFNENDEDAALKSDENEVKSGNAKISEDEKKRRDSKDSPAKGGRLLGAGGTELDILKQTEKGAGEKTASALNILKQTEKGAGEKKTASALNILKQTEKGAGEKTASALNILKQTEKGAGEKKTASALNILLEEKQTEKGAGEKKTASALNIFVEEKQTEKGAGEKTAGALNILLEKQTEKGTAGEKKTASAEKKTASAEKKTAGAEKKKDTLLDKRKRSSTPSSPDSKRHAKGHVILGFENATLAEGAAICAEWTDTKAALEVFLNVNIEVLPENHVGKPGISPPLPDSRKPFCILLQQGVCSVVEKAACAEEIGAVGFLVFRKDKGEPFAMSHAAENPPNLHGMMISQEVGETLYGACMGRKGPRIHQVQHS